MMQCIIPPSLTCLLGMVYDVLCVYTGLSFIIFLTVFTKDVDDCAVYISLTVVTLHLSLNSGMMVTRYNPYFGMESDIYGPLCLSSTCVGYNFEKKNIQHTWKGKRKWGKNKEELNLVAQTLIYQTLWVVYSKMSELT